MIDHNCLLPCSKLPPIPFYERRDKDWHFLFSCL
uniref:Uncharacterized protein n=1 Tax=Arundo donax TaxID=35708 RepID=A0A0A9BQM7_ARUDO